MTQLGSLISKAEDAIAEDKLLVIAITSQAKGALDSDETAFGGGKTTFALRMSRRLNHFDPAMKLGWDAETLDSHDYDERTWEDAFTNLWYFPIKMLDSVQEATEKRITLESQLLATYRSEHPEDPKLLKFDLGAARAKTILRAGVWDDAQYSAGSGSGVPKALKDLRGELTTERLGIAVLIITSNSYGEIASPIRSLVQEEIIIPKRGSIEVQHHQRKKDFKRGSKEKDILIPREAWDSTVNGPLFKPLPPVIQLRYNAWRHEQKKLAYPMVRSELNRYQRLLTPSEQLDPATPKAVAMVVTPGMGRKEKDTV